MQLGFRRGGHGRRRHLGGLRLLFPARQQLIHTHLQRGSQLRQGGDVRQAKAAFPLAYRLVRHAQCVCKLLLCHIQRLAAGRHKSAYFFAIHSNASFWCAARCIHNAGPRCLACLLYHTPPGRGNTRPVEALSTQRRAGRAPARPANTCKMQARRGACFYRPSAHGIANERYHKLPWQPNRRHGGFPRFVRQPGAKPFAAAHGRKNSGACFLCSLPVYKAMTAVLLPPEASPAIWGRPRHEKARQP